MKRGDKVTVTTAIPSINGFSTVLPQDQGHVTYSVLWWYGTGEYHESIRRVLLYTTTV